MRDHKNGNVPNELGRLSDQRRDALSIAHRLDRRVGSGTLIITGHSLGGGLASLAAAVTNRPAVTFNAAGIRNSVLAELGISRTNAESRIRAV
ncbi:MAG: lipase family protein [Allosphingosinicella sp.]|uniref:lipase family protein n=1 Tax=Allosphingosinicella sp. TaxID=2823234 RepID=UPI003938C9BA